MVSLKEMVTGDKKVKFVFYRDKALHYKTEDGFIFPVPIEEAGSATFRAEERAMLMMRYIRKHLKAMQTARQRQNTF